MPQSIVGMELEEKFKIVESVKLNLVEVAREHKATPGVKRPPLFIRTSFDETLSIWTRKKIEHIVRKRTRSVTNSHRRLLIQNSKNALQEVAKRVIELHIDPVVRLVCSNPDPLFYHQGGLDLYSKRSEFKGLPGGAKNCCRVLVRELFPNKSCFSGIDKPLWKLQRQKEVGVRVAVLEGLHMAPWESAVDEFLNSVESLG